MESEEDQEISIIDALEIEERQARINKLNAELKYIKYQQFFYPLVILSGTTLAAVAVVKLFL